MSLCAIFIFLSIIYSENLFPMLSKNLFTKFLRAPYCTSKHHMNKQDLLKINQANDQLLTMLEKVGQLESKAIDYQMQKDMYDCIGFGGICGGVIELFSSPALGLGLASASCLGIVCKDIVLNNKIFEKHNQIKQLVDEYLKLQKEVKKILEN